MVMVIVRLLRSQNYRLRGWQAVKANWKAVRVEEPLQVTFCQAHQAVEAVLGDLRGVE
jgi:hypothetical protein